MHKQLLNAAKELFWAFGVKKVKVEEICQKAGVSKMSFYRNFENKVDIAEKLLIELLEEGMTRYRRIMGEEIPFDHKIQAIIKEKHKNAEGLSKLFLQDIYTHYPEIMQHIEVYRKQALHEHMTDLRQAQKEGYIRQDVKLDFVMFMLEHIHVLLQDNALLDMFESTQEATDSLTRFIFYGVMDNHV